jgi:hypothetical protein
MVDELGTNASTTAYGLVPEATTLTELVAAQGAWVAGLDAIIGGAITGSSVTLVQPGLTTDKGNGAGQPASGSRVEQTAVINFKNAINSHRWGEAIPSVADAKIVAGKFDLTDTAVAAFIAIMTGALGAGNYTNPYLQAISGVKDAILSFREHRRQLQRSSFEL